MHMFAVPSIVIVFTSLAAILLINKLSSRLTFSIFGGTLLLAIWCGYEPQEILGIACTRMVSSSSIFLMTVVMQVIWFSSQMSKTGAMNDLVECVKGVFPARGAMAVLPAVIGLLPMPGGAIFSAPLLDNADNKRELSPILKTQINYWFRHLWEYWWPLYPGVILAIELTGLTELAFIGLGFPLSLLSVFAGYVFLLRKIPKRAAVKSENGTWRHFVMLLSPLFVLIGVYSIITFFTSLPLPEFAGLPAPLTAIIMGKYFPMIMGIGTAQMYLQKIRPLAKEEWRKIILNPSTLNLAAIVLAVNVYGAFIQGDLPEGGRLMDRVRDELTGFGIPVIAVIMSVPFIAGIATGIAVGMVGAAFPVVMGLLGEVPSARELYSSVLLAYAFGYMGMMLSPVHVCLIVTNKHFSTSLPKSLINLVRPAAMVIAGALMLYAAIRYS